MLLYLNNKHVFNTHKNLCLVYTLDCLHASIWTKIATLSYSTQKQEPDTILKHNYSIGQKTCVVSKNDIDTCCFCIYGIKCCIFIKLGPNLANIWGKGERYCKFSDIITSGSFGAPTFSLFHEFVLCNKNLPKGKGNIFMLLKIDPKSKDFGLGR
jgi:hypothetical protein